jgi:hypothetical protein
MRFTGSLRFPVAGAAATTSPQMVGAARAGRCRISAKLREKRGAELPFSLASAAER